MNIKNIFIDLDNTLWDFEKNNKECLLKMFTEYDLKQIVSVTFEEFYNATIYINHCLWEQFYNGSRSKVLICFEKFNHVLSFFNCSNASLAHDLLTFEENNLPKETVLIPYAEELVSYLHSKKYKLFILSNGLKEIQTRKIMNCGLLPFFDFIYTSDEVEFEKPNKEFFEYVLTKSKAKSAECIMIGNNAFTDILGAKNAGISQIYFNSRQNTPPVNATYEVHSLLDIKNIL